MDEKTIQRIKKLQALAERGVGGEKTTAQKKLAKLLKDNGINSLDELQKEEYEYTIFSYNGKHEIKLLRQCMYKVMGAKSDRTAYKPYGRRQKIGIYCTKAQKIEIELEFEFYRNVFYEEYVERVTKAGNTIEIERYFTSRYKKKGISRGDKVKPTKEEQEKVNTRQAERKLRILINANYGYGDYHLVLDYIRRKGEPDRTPEQMRQDIDVFLRECRKEYRKAGLEFKYIHVMEIGKKGARHHHLVVNKIDTEILQRCWYKAYEGHNRVKVFPLDDSGNYAELASYLIKYTGTHKKGTDGALQGKRWNCSKNLVRPEPEYHIISDREYFKKEPKAIKGYYVDKNSVSMGVHSPEYYGYGYLRYTLVKITDRGG